MIIWFCDICYDKVFYCLVFWVVVIISVFCKVYVDVLVDFVVGIVDAFDDMVRY